MIVRHALAVTVAVLALSIAAYAGEPPLLPDQTLTPGVVASTDQAVVCGTGAGGTYSQQHRQTSAALKAEVYKRYGIPHPPASQAKNWEVDHRLQLALGGADTLLNLWPQSRTTCPWNANVKDLLEDHLWRAVCREHTMPLAEAQAALLGDWTAAYAKYLGPAPPCKSP